MMDAYAPCLCGSGQKFKFCCSVLLKKEGVIPPIKEISKYPIYECKVLKNGESTVASIFVVREIDKNSYLFLGYLVDFGCLGVKDTMMKFGISKTELKDIYTRHDTLESEPLLETISYQDARSMILGAIDFAKKIEIAPHPSWNGMPSSFIEAHLDYEKKFSFGLNGKPYYIVGPYDHESYDIEKIIEKVVKAHGCYNLSII